MAKQHSAAIDFRGRAAPSPWLWQWVVQGSAAAPYNVSVREGLSSQVLDKTVVVWGCSCPASRNMVDGRECKHVLRIQVGLLTDSSLQLFDFPAHVRALLNMNAKTIAPAAQKAVKVLDGPRRLKVIS